MSNNQAIVIGAGMGGMAAARALADHFKNVIIIERDKLPVEAENRAGTAQDRHLHMLQTAGLRILEEFFSGFEHDLIKAGAARLQVGLDLRNERPGFDPFPQRDLGWHSYSMTRPLLESLVRKRMKAIPNITFKEQCRVLEIQTCTNTSAAEGVRYTDSEGNTRTEKADFIIDASGRGELTIGALDSLFMPGPKRTVIGVGLCYGTATFEIPDSAPSDWKCVLVEPEAPHGTAGGLLGIVEGNRWLVAVGDRHGKKVPVNKDEFFEFLRSSLRTKTIYNAVKGLEPIGDIARFGFPNSEWRHYEKLTEFPKGLLPFADAVCRFNPVYAQGMTVALQQGALLSRILKEQAVEAWRTKGFTSAFLTELHSILESPWSSGAVPDLVYPETKGDRPANFDFSVKFGKGIVRLGARDPAVHKLMMEHHHMLKTNAVFRTPEFMERIRAEMSEA